ncbi:hypothetical protein KUCAC02_037586, partial [Chaenocephalus aceratus]
IRKANLICVRHQAGQSGKTVPELEKTIGLMKKVVERVQRENETLKKSGASSNQDKISALEQQNDRLKTDYEKLKRCRRVWRVTNEKLEGRAGGNEAETDSPLSPNPSLRGLAAKTSKFYRGGKLKEVREREENAQIHIRKLEDQIRETSSQLDTGALKQLLHVAQTEKTQLQTEVKKLKEELENFDPSFFEEIEDLKYNYNSEVTKNILLEEQLRKVCEKFGVEVELPVVSVS